MSSNHAATGRGLNGGSINPALSPGLAAAGFCGALRVSTVWTWLRGGAGPNPEAFPLGAVGEWIPTGRRHKETGGEPGRDLARGQMLPWQPDRCSRLHPPERSPRRRTSSPAAAQTSDLVNNRKPQEERCNLTLPDFGSSPDSRACSQYRRVSTTGVAACRAGHSHRSYSQTIPGFSSVVAITENLPLPS